MENKEFYEKLIEIDKINKKNKNKEKLDEIYEVLNQLCKTDQIGCFSAFCKWLEEFYSDIFNSCISILDSNSTINNMKDLILKENYNNIIKIDLKLLEKIKIPKN